MRIRPGVIAVFGVLMISGSLFAQTESGPGPGAKLKPFKVLAVTGDDAGKELEVVAADSKKPAVLLFVKADRWDRPVARFVKTLDQELDKQGRTDLDVVAVWLTDDVESSKEYLPRAQQSIQLSRTALTVFPGAADGPLDWSIHPEAHLTVVIADAGKSTANFGYRSVNETDVRAVLKKVPERK